MALPRNLLVLYYPFAVPLAHSSCYTNSGAVTMPRICTLTGLVLQSNDIMVRMRRIVAEHGLNIKSADVVEALSHLDIILIMFVHKKRSLRHLVQPIRRSRRSPTLLGRASASCQGQRRWGRVHGGAHRGKMKSKQAARPS